MNLPSFLTYFFAYLYFLVTRMFSYFSNYIGYVTAKVVEIGYSWHGLLAIVIYFLTSGVAARLWPDSYRRDRSAI